jgi:hypothetical protein
MEWGRALVRVEEGLDDPSDPLRTAEETRVFDTTSVGSSLAPVLTMRSKRSRQGRTDDLKSERWGVLQPTGNVWRL